MSAHTIVLYNVLVQKVNYSNNKKEGEAIIECGHVQLVLSHRLLPLFFVSSDLNVSLSSSLVDFF